jgi:integrase
MIRSTAVATFNFTEQGIKALKATDAIQVDHWDDKVTGFGIRVSKSGRKTWFFYYRFKGAKRRYTFGTYPILSLAEARDMAKIALHQVATGIDPSAEKQADREAETFKEFSELYMIRHAKQKKRSWKEDQRNLDKDILPEWKNLKAKDITRKHVSQLLAGIKNRGVKVHDNKIFALIRKMFNFGIEQGILTPNSNPCQGMARPSEETSRDRNLAPDELKAVWAAVELQRPIIQVYFILGMLLAQRGVEIRTMEWSELDLEKGIWSLPGTKTKNKRPHKVPLCKQVLDLLKSINYPDKKSIWVFPNPRNPEKCMSNIQKALQRVRSKSGLPEMKSGKETIPSFVAHDFRRTVATQMASAGVPRFIVKKILNHITKGDVTDVYDRYDYFLEMRKSLENWAERLERIVTGKEETATVHEISNRMSKDLPVEKKCQTAAVNLPDFASKALL